MSPPSAAQMDDVICVGIAGGCIDSGKLCDMCIRSGTQFCSVGTIFQHEPDNDRDYDKYDQSSWNKSKEVSGEEITVLLRERGNRRTVCDNDTQSG